MQQVKNGKTKLAAAVALTRTRIIAVAPTR